MKRFSYKTLALLLMGMLGAAAAVAQQQAAPQRGGQRRAAPPPNPNQAGTLSDGHVKLFIPYTGYTQAENDRILNMYNGLRVSDVADGLDVASGGELAVALDAGANPRCISFAGPGKSIDELACAVAAGILINVESLREIRALADISQRTGTNARVAVRVNPDFELKMSGMKMGGGPKQFGIDAEQIPEALAAIGEAGLAFEGFNVFSGSQNLQATAICESQVRSLELVVRLAEHAPGPVRSVNLGGGFGIPYFSGDKPLDLAPIGANLASLV